MTHKQVRALGVVQIMAGCAVAIISLVQAGVPLRAVTVGLGLFVAFGLLVLGLANVLFPEVNPKARKGET